jgi:hypothetical protein
MQGLWQRRKVNLNATTQQTVLSNGACATPTSPPPTSTSTPSDEPPRPAESVPPPAFGAVVEGTPPLPPSTSSQNKRKLRSTRGDEYNKRSRTGAGNTSKEYSTRRQRCAQFWAAWTHAWRKCSSSWQCLLHTPRSTSIPACYNIDLPAAARLCLRTLLAGCAAPLYLGHCIAAARADKKKLVVDDDQGS